MRGLLLLLPLYSSGFSPATPSNGPIPRPPGQPVPTSRPVPRPASSFDVDEGAQGAPTEDWRAFRAKLEGAGLDAAAREAWADSPAKDAWAHALDAPEAGGLLLGLPFAATLCHAASPWRADVLRFSTRRCMAAAKALAVPASRVTSGGPAREPLLRDARKFAGAELRRVMAIEPDLRTPKDRQFLEARAAAIRRARDVVLVLALDEDGGAAGVRVGQLARGSPWGSRRRSAALCAALELDAGGMADFHDFHAAFGNDVAVYLGGRGAAEDGDWEGVGWEGSALMLHARPGLEGAVELAPGCGLYRGGAAAAARLVAQGEADASEFAFFVGSYDFGPGELRGAVRAGLYQPALCARAVVLGGRSDAGLETSRADWHELMKTLGGPSAEVEAFARGAPPPL